jgi:tetratricopeptide (TPR) repeat protein
MNWTSSRNPLPAAVPSKKSAQLEKILATAKNLLAAGNHEEAIAELNRKGGTILREAVGQMMLGSIYSLSGRTEKALAAFDAAVRIAPKSAQAHFNRGFALKQLGRPAEAAVAYEAALKIDPNMVEARHNLAVVLNEVGRFEEALVAADAAIALKASSAEAHYNRGVVLASLGRHEDAVAAFDTALRFRGAYFDAAVGKGASLKALSRFDDAVATFQLAARIDPNRIDAHIARAVVLREAGRLEDALAAIDDALAIAPDNYEAAFSRGGVLDALDRHEEALVVYNDLAERDPNSIQPLVNRGNVLRALHRYEEALADYDRVLEAVPTMTGVALNRAAALTALDRFEEALDLCDRVLEAAQSRPLEPIAASGGRPPVEPGWEAIIGRADALRHMHRFDEALAEYDRALAEKPGSIALIADRSLLQLAMGRMDVAWAGYEYRTLSDKNPVYKPLHSAPAWDGGPVGGKRLLVTGEQGLGDVIQFARYLPPLIAEAAEVRLATTPRIFALLRSGFPDLVLGEQPKADEAFDFQIRLLSIPGVRGTTLETIPADVPYLRPDAARVAAWKARLPDAPLRIGIHWQGNKDFGGDRRRSFALAEFAPLARIPGVRLISLQKGPGVEQLDNLPPGMLVDVLGDDFDSGPDAFLDSAAVMASLDLVVSSDSAIVHLAGALGRPTWVALTHLPDWRWLLERTDTPWYPTMRLFRQPRSGDWASVFANITREVAALAEAKRG